MTYRNVVAAVVRALAAETINSAGGNDFEPKVQCAKLKGEIIGKDASQLIDCMVHSRLHKALTNAQWLALVAKYSTHSERKHEAIIHIAKKITSPAPERFRHAAVVTWAIPKLPGAQGKRSTSVLPEAWYVLSNWCDEGRPEPTLYRWRTAIRRNLESMVNDALVAAQEVLDAEGLIENRAA
ncbi:hypothetical protein LS633_25255 [Pseudomonas sp. NIBR-H-19]|uniref:hypothetical protein n=1 Tax=Pseudomonas sp. NIBR-H-19 TaxID=2901380 RepID=UPI001E4771DF|nr:hypothetical protein [Pseudomonas sp. NIBR-H-19]UHC81676.1 hypothetical protein LS633_25255 [Pseudomonas sp. NIBR-H-19]